MKRFFSPPVLFLAAAFLTASCGEKPEPEGPARPVMEATVRAWVPVDKFMRHTLAREHFLSAVPVWQDDHARKIVDLARRYNVIQEKWTNGMLPPQTLTDEESGKMGQEMMDIQNKLTEAFNQSGKLTPEGAKVLAAWETRHWNGYLLPQDFFHDALPPHKSAPANTPQEKAAADFRARRAEMAQPLIEALGKVSPKPGEKEKEKENPLERTGEPPGPKQPGADVKQTGLSERPVTTVASRLGLPELTTKNREAMKALRDQCEESARLYAQWAAKGWEGYVSGGAP